LNNIYFFFLLLLLLWSAPGLSQKGTEFWFVAPEVTSGYADRPIYLRISSYGQPASVIISQPANSAFAPITVSLLSYQTQTVNLTANIASIENAPANTVLNYGLLIESTSDISAYYEVESTGNNPDIFTLKAHNAIGLKFVIPAQSFWGNSSAYVPTAFSAFDIVATSDGTTVTITPSNNIVGHTANVAFTVSLNKGQTYSARATSRQAALHLAGSVVNSNKPIAITISDDAVTKASYGSCEDLLGDQLVPLTVIGDEYIVSKGYLAKNPGPSLADKVYITAAHNGTDVYLNGSGAPAASLNKGDTYEVSLTANDLHILATQNVYVLHVTGVGCEAAMAVVPRIVCSGSSEISFVRSSSQDFYLLLFVPAGGQGSFEINGNKHMVSSSSFKSVMSSFGQWKVARLKFSNTDIVTGNPYTITNTNKLFHAAIINGNSGFGCVYGFFSDFDIVRTDPIFHFK
tara:strand:+ start:497 stop:1876 length:1380 start_codon:yes stop_codon:yes gene_type:complete